MSRLAVGSSRKSHAGPVASSRPPRNWQRIARHLDALLLAARELLEEAAFIAGEIDRLDASTHHRPLLVARTSPDRGQSERNDLEHREGKGDAVLLREHRPAPRQARCGMEANLWPPSSTSPPTGRISPVIAFIRVDFPAPFGPTTIVSSPGRRASETSCRTARPESATETLRASNIRGRAASGGEAAARGRTARRSGRSGCRSGAPPVRRPRGRPCRLREAARRRAARRRESTAGATAR